MLPNIVYITVTSDLNFNDGPTLAVHHVCILCHRVLMSMPVDLTKNIVRSVRLDKLLCQLGEQ